MTTRDIVYIALFASLSGAMALFPPIPVPIGTGIPIVVQSIAPLLAGGVIGARRGALSMVLFLVLVSIGLPLLSGGRGGLAALLGPAGGFALSWIAVAGLVGWLIERRHGQAGLAYRTAVNVLGAIVISYPIGILWLSFATQLPLLKAATAASVYLPGDCVKLVIAAVIGTSIQRAYPVISR